MVTFATLFLGLVVGVQSVAVLVGDGVAAVELLVNGETVGVLRGEPWSLDYDFGLDLLPQELEAVAYDERGRELGRARQWLNLPRDPAEAALIVDSDAGGKVARLTWQSTDGAEPQALRVSFDGKPLPVVDPERIPLPRHSNDRLHFLRAELDFSENVSTVVEVTFGGFYADEVNTELTALPVLVAEGEKLPDASELQGWVVEADRSPRVVAAEKGPAELILVRDHSVQELVATMRRGLFSPPSLRRHMYSLRGDVRARYVWPYAEKRQGRDQIFHLFPATADHPMGKVGMLWLVYGMRQPSYPLEEQRLADAVAVAGMNAAARNRRRAVILVLGHEVVDHSDFVPRQVRGYLESLRVPFFVWCLVPPGPQLAAAWGPVRDVSDFKKLRRAVRELDEVLHRQRILWLDGVYLPQSLELSAEAVGLRLALENRRVAGSP